MKQDSLQHLLAKYQEGTLTGEELERLNELTHRDEVLSAAEGRARTIVRRRTMRAVGFGMVAVALLGAGVWMLAPRQQQSMVAAVNEEIVLQDEAPLAPVDSPSVETPEAPTARPLVAAVTAEEKAVPKVVDVEYEAVEEEPIFTPADPSVNIPQSPADPVVVCNNHCDADSVISDIWKFLSA